MVSNATLDRAAARPMAEPPARRRSALGRHVRGLQALVWLGPAVALIGFAVGWPVVSMFRTSALKVNSFGLVEGSNGFNNFRKLFAEPQFWPIIERTIVWVVVVVLVTTVVSLGLAQLFNKAFPGRRFTRWGLIAPWAASVLMTAIVFKWMLSTTSGLLNVIGHALGLVANVDRADPLGQAATSFPWLIIVAIFVSLPFTTYAILAGHSSIPEQLYEAAAIDGASKARIYRSITLPLLRPAIVIATLINIMNVFNNFPIIWAMTHGQPGYSTATTTVFMYILKGSDIGESAAMSVINFIIVVILAGIFLRASGWKAEVE